VTSSTHYAPAPTDAEVHALIAQMRSWRRVEPDQMAALRSAVADLGALDQHLRVIEVAAILRVSESTVRNLIKQGTLRAYTLSGRKGSEFRIPESAVTEYLQAVAR
jgi:excisionase family DNA binding protein